VAIATRGGFAAADAYGRVVFSGLPVPGAIVTATRGDTKLTTVSDQNGVCRFADLADGPWTIRIEMPGFATVTQDTTFAPGVESPTWELKLLPFEEITRGVVLADPGASAAAPAVASNAGATPVSPAESGTRTPTGGFQRAGVNTSPGPAAPSGSPGPSAPSLPPPPPALADGDSAAAAADGFLINGSVNNGATSPFAQSAAFGNNRPGSRSLYNGGVGTIFGNSSWDARPFSFTGRPSPKPDYSDVQFLGTFGGPIKIPGVTNRPTIFLGYQRSLDHSALTQSALMPSVLERRGDFSQTLDAFGHPVQIIDPATGAPFDGNVIPRERITSQAASLLGYYPAPNTNPDSTLGGYNFQRPVLTTTQQDSVQARITQTLNNRNQLIGNFAYQRTATDSAGLFAFPTSTTVSAIDTTIGWSRRFSMFLSLRLRYQFTRQKTNSVPYFSNRTNVSGEAGITGNDQEPENWGPPTLLFSSGLAGLGDTQYALNNNRTNAWNAEAFWNHGRHNVTFGGDVRLHQFDVFAQQDARGTLAFTGSATGSDLADFLLGLPQTSSIAFGNADKYLRAGTYDAYINDDWRVAPALTINAGLRWEFEMPLTEQFGRLANLDIAPGFSAVSTVAADNPVGTLTGTQYPESLIRPDFSGIQPRVGVSWRPVPGSSLVVRGGYGFYRNTGVYQSLAMLLAQQPPFSKTGSVETSPENPLTLANPFTSPGGAMNTFAIDPNFRVGFSQTWQLSAQRDLPASLTMIATYLGTRGSRLMQEFLPNTYPVGASTPCVSCPLGFVYLTSDGRSIRHSGQLQLRRRLRNGLTATVQYTLAKANDDAGAFTGVSLSGAAIAQDWLNLDAEWAPSNFDQRHLLTAQFQYTTGIGVAGGALLDGWKGTLVKGWTLTSQLTAGSGLPLSPVYLTSVPGTGVTGTIRGELTDSAPEDVPPGYYANPAAYAAPVTGRWGNAGRNSVRGPSQFSLNAGILRSFSVNQRLNLDWRIDAINVLNHVTFSGINGIVGSPQFGLPNRANSMRKLQSTLRLRF